MKRVEEIEWEDSSEEEAKEDAVESMWVVGKKKELSKNQEQLPGKGANPNALRAPYTHGREDREKRYQMREMKRLDNEEKRAAEKEQPSTWRRQKRSAGWRWRNSSKQLRK